MAKQQKRTTETAPLKWQEAQNLLKLLKADGAHEKRLLFALGFYTGLRISDILRLEWETITGAAKFQVTEGKTGKVRLIDVHSDFAQIVKDTKNATENPTGYIFRSKRGKAIGQRLTVVGANKWIRETLEKYGVKTQNPSSHTLRKTFARRVYDLNGQTEDALIVLSAIFRHSGPAMTRKYIGLTNERISNVYLTL